MEGLGKSVGINWRFPTIISLREHTCWVNPPFNNKLSDLFEAVGNILDSDTNEEIELSNLWLVSVVAIKSLEVWGQ